MSIGGSVTIDVNGKETEVDAANDLPPGIWTVRSISVWQAKQVTDAGLKELAGLDQMFVQTLADTQVTRPIPIHRIRAAALARWPDHSAPGRGRPRLRVGLLSEKTDPPLKSPHLLRRFAPHEGVC
jgi:hypothetical protein